MTPTILAALSTGSAIAVAVIVFYFIVAFTLAREGEIRDSHFRRPEHKVKPEKWPYEPKDSFYAGDDS